MHGSPLSHKVAVTINHFDTTGAAIDMARKIFDDLASGHAEPDSARAYKNDLMRAHRAAMKAATENLLAECRKEEEDLGDELTLKTVLEDILTEEGE